MCNPEQGYYGGSMTRRERKMIMINFIRDKIGHIMLSNRFEINNTNTQTLTRALIVCLLHELQSRHEISDFKVICDDSNNPEDFIEQNKMRVTAFVRVFDSVTDEFVELDCTMSSEGVSFEELANG